MDLKRLTWHEFVAMAGAVILAIGLFLPWYHAENQRAEIAGTTGPGDFTGWEVHTTIRYLLLAAAAAPLILAWIIIRQHQLSWPKGELTAVVACTALVLILVVGFISRPGEPRSGITLQIGWYLGLLACIGMLVGAAQRSAEGQTKKPPGTL